MTLAEPRMKRYVHELVAEAFIGPRPPGYHIAHWDGDGHNNVVTNLRYATVAENHADKIRHGRTNRGERCGASKLTVEQVAQIREMYGPRKPRRKGYVPQRVIAEVFGISQQQVSAIVSGANWAYDKSGSHLSDAGLDDVAARMDGLFGGDDE